MGQSKESAGGNELQAAEPDATSPAEPLERDTIPSSVEFKQTLPTGAAFHATWKMPAWRPSAPLSETSESGVRRLDLPEPVSRESFGQTLRMDIGLPPAQAPVEPEPEEITARGPHNEPRDTLEPAFPISPTRRAAFSRSGEAVLAASMQRVGDSADSAAGDAERSPSARPTDPFGRPAEGQRVKGQRVEGRRVQDTLFEGSDVGVVDAVPRSAAYQAAGGAMDHSSRGAATERPWGDVRPRYAHDEYRKAYEAESEAGGWLGRLLTAPWRGKKLFMTVAMISGALGMLALSALGDEDLGFGSTPADDTGDTGSLITESEGEPHIVTPAPLPTAAAPALQSAPKVGLPVAAAAADGTVIVTVPENAEILRGDAIIANTPSRVTRPSTDTEFLVRLPGYQSQVIRLGPSSPARISVQLTPSAAPADLTAETGARTGKAKTERADATEHATSTEVKHP